MKKQNLLKKLTFLLVWLVATSQGFAQTWKVYNGAALLNYPNSSGVTFVGGNVGTTDSLSVDQILTKPNGNKDLNWEGSAAYRNSWNTPNAGATISSLSDSVTLMFRVKNTNTTGTTNIDQGFELELYTYNTFNAVAYKFIFYQACNGYLYFDNPTTGTPKKLTYSLANQENWHTYRLTVTNGDNTGAVCKLYIDEHTIPDTIFKSTTTTTNKMYIKTGCPNLNYITSMKTEVDWMAWDFTGAFPPSSNLPANVFVDSVYSYSGKSITSFSIDSTGSTDIINEGLGIITVTVPKYTNVISLKPTIVHSPGSILTPTGAWFDFTDTVTFTVAADDYSTKNYKVKVNVATLNDKKAITAFSIPGQLGSSVINTTAHTVTLTMPYGTVVTALVPTIDISLDAGISPLSGVTQDFTSTVNYTVTAEDASTQVWAVTVSIAPNTATLITAFEFNGLAPAVIGVSDTTNKIVRLTVPYGTDLTALVPTIALSPNATISPLSGVPQNFTDTVVYTVTAGDGITTKIWKVKVDVTPAATDATLSDLKIDGVTISGFSPAITQYTHIVPSGVSIVPTVTATKNNVFAADPVITPAAAIPDTTKVMVIAQNGASLTYNVIFIHPSTDVWTIYDGSKRLDDPTNTYPFTLSQDVVPLNPTDTVVDDEDIAGNKVIRFESQAAYKNLFTINPFAIADDSSKITIIARLRDYKDSINTSGGTKFVEKNSDIDVYFATYREKWFGQNATKYTKPNIKAEKRNQSGVPYGVDSVHVKDIAHWHIYRVVIDTALGTRLFVDEKLDSVNGGYYKTFAGAPTFRLALGDGSSSTSYSALYDYVIWTKGAYAPGEGPAIPPQLSTTYWSDCSLKELKINDTVYSAFDPKTLTYTVVLPDNLTIPTISGTTNNIKADTVTTNITKLPGEAKIVVTAEDGVTKAQYTINFTYVGAPSIISSLSDLMVSGTTVNGFASAVLSYNNELAAGTTVVPVVTAVTTDAKATAVVTPAASLPGKTTILVTAEDTSYKTTYEINFTVAKSTDAKLTGITYGITPISNFSANTSHYSIHLPVGTTVVPTVTVTKSNAAATYVITPATTLPGSTTIVVTAEDGTTTRTYYVDFSVLTGIGMLSEGEISVFPNPANNILNIKNRIGLKGNVSIYNLLGETVLLKSINGSETLNISSLKSGLYLVKINVDGKFYIQKIEVLR